MASTGHLGRSVSIISAAYSPLGFVNETPEILNFSERELFALSCMEAMEKGNITAKDIDAFYVGVSGPAYEAKLKSAGPHFGAWIGMDTKPTLFHDEGCGTSGYGLHQAVLAVASGQYDCVISGAVNINFSSATTGYPPYLRHKTDWDDLAASTICASDAAYQKPSYGGMAPLEAILVRYAIENGLTYDNLDECFVNYLVSKRGEALLNPKAVLVNQTYEEEAKSFGFDTVKDYLFSNKFNPRMGSLIRRRFLGAAVDGSSAVIVCATDKAKKYVKHPIEVAGFATSSPVEKYFCEAPMPGDVKMFKEAYAMAGITDPYKEIEYMGIHDCPATMILSYAEASGYFKKGEAFRHMIAGELTHEYAKPITTSGGRCQSGHPRSPAFVIEVSEAIDQMRGEAGARQMQNPPRISLIEGGGSGFNIAACVLKAL